MQTPLHAQQYIWPTEASPYLSSTFGETRSAHFHAGLDIKTWGREGYRVFASRKGKVHRILITERGYGKALYLKHEDGTYTVYAHLQRFNEKIQAYADSIRLHTYTAEIDLRVDSLNFEFAPRDVIGYSGSSGIGPPHLHFEIRDTMQHPVNALTSNLSVPDDIPPIFKSIIVEPLTKNSRVEGTPYSKYRKAEKTEDGTYNFGTFSITDEVGMAVNVHDRANKVRNSYAVYELYLVHRSDTLFYEQIKSYNYEDAHEMFLNRIAPFGANKRGHQRLYDKEGSNNPFLLTAHPTAKISLADSTETYTIIARDYFGNTAKAHISFIPLPRQNVTKSTLSKPPSEWYWNENWASPDLNSTIDLENPGIGFPWKRGQRILFSEDTTLYTLARIIPDTLSKVTTPDHRLKAVFFGNEFHDTLSVAVSHNINKDGIQLSIQAGNVVSRSSYLLEFYVGDFLKTNAPHHLYHRSKDGKLSFLNSKLVGGTIHAMPSTLGEFVVLSDSIPPSVRDFRIQKTNYGKWLGIAQVTDPLSGIDSKTAKFYINGKRGIAEFDYEEELLIYYLPDFSPQNSNTATLIISDKAGNRTTSSMSFQFPASASY